MAYSAQQVADYFLTNQTNGPPITHLKLQKMLYYAQAISLAVLERPLFHEKIERWKYGPVVSALYPRYKQYNYSPIPPSTPSKTPFDEGVMRLLSNILRVYGRHSPNKLRDMTHEEDPWKNTQDGHAILFKDMARYFQEQPETYERFANYTPEEIRELARTPEVLEGIRAGLEDRRAGRMISLDDIRGELGI